MLLANSVPRSPAASRPYHRRAVRAEFRGSLAKYQALLMGRYVTIHSIATALDLTYDGARSSIDRMVARGQVVRVREAKQRGNAGKMPALYTWKIKREGKMTQWDRFDIAEAYCCLEWDYNHGGWLKERPSNVRRRESIGVQLHRLQWGGRDNLSFETLTDNGKEIYLRRVIEWKLPIDDDMKRRCEETFVPEYLAHHRPAIWAPVEH